MLFVYKCSLALTQASPSRLCDSKLMQEILEKPENTLHSSGSLPAPREKEREKERQESCTNTHSEED